MKGKASKKVPEIEADRSLEKLDRVVQLLENLFILQALEMGIGRDAIRGVLGIGPNRISEINQGIKRNAKNGRSIG